MPYDPLLRWEWEGGAVPPEDDASSDADASDAGDDGAAIESARRGRVAAVC